MSASSAHLSTITIASSHADMRQAIVYSVRQSLPMCFIVLVLFVFLALLPSTAGASLSSKSTSDEADLVMSPVETEAVYQVLEAINSKTAWRILYPGNLCLEGPHGLICGADELNVLHILELNLGWVSEADNNAPCGPNASINPAIVRFPYLRKLFFYNCFTVSKVVLPSFLWSLGASLEELVFLRNPRLVGNLPGDIAKLGNMKRLILAGNALQGSIPTQLGEMSELIQLVLSRNEFTGVIPETLGVLKKLRIADLSWNMIESGIPSSIVSGMHHLQKLDLSHNKLTGNIPAGIGEAVSLKLLDLSWNNLSGPLPDSSFGRLTHLRVLQVGHNAFNGSVIPASVWTNLKHLVGVGLAEAGLGGRIPEELGQLRSLRYLDLRGNKLEGPIPESLGRLPTIFEMDLSGNQLQGVLPFSLEFMLHMGRNLRIADNEGLCSSPDLNSSALVVDVGLPVCNHQGLFLTSQSIELSSQHGFVQSSDAAKQSELLFSMLQATMLVSLAILVT